MIKTAVFLHRWLGVALCLFFLLWFPSGIGMMYWDFPAVTVLLCLPILCYPIEARLHRYVRRTRVRWVDCVLRFLRFPPLSRGSRSSVFVGEATRDGVMCVRSVSCRRN